MPSFPHSPTLQPVQRLYESGSHTTQLLPSPGIAWHINFSGASVHSSSGFYHLCVSSHFVSIPPSDFRNPGPSWCQAALPALVEEGAGDLTLLPLSCSRHWGEGFSSLHPRTDPRDLTVPVQSPHCLFFNVLYNFWPPNFIYAGIPLSVHSTPGKIG